MLVIRPYSEEDQAAVVGLWRQVFPDSPAWNQPEGDIQRKLAVQRELFLVALLEGELVGTAMAGFDERDSTSAQRPVDDQLALLIADIDALGAIYMIIVAIAIWPEFVDMWQSNDFFGVPGVFTAPWWPVKPARANRSPSSRSCLP